MHPSNSSGDELTISIAGIPVTLVLGALDSTSRATILERYVPFRARGGRGIVTVELQVLPGPQFIPVPERGTWQIETTNNRGQIRFESHFESGWADLGTGEAHLTLRPRSSPENFLRVVYAWLCLGHHALLLHACGVIRQGQGYVFFGPSGSGKTTIARLSNESIVLSDDLVIIRKQGDIFFAHGVPFRGDLPEAPRANAAAPLAGLFTLVKDSDHMLEPVAPFVAVARLAAAVPFVMEQREHAARVMDICADLERAVPVRALHFRRDPGFWGVIDE
jgi:hypothetical protein